MRPPPSVPPPDPRRPFRVVARPAADGFVLEVVGDLDLRTDAELSRAAIVVLQDRPAELLLDLSAVTFCDARGVGALLRCARIAGGAGTRLRLAPSEEVAHVLRLCDVLQDVVEPPPA